MAFSLALKEIIKQTKKNTNVSDRFLAVKCVCVCVCVSNLNETGSCFYVDSLTSYTEFNYLVTILFLHYRFLMHIVALPLLAKISAHFTAFIIITSFDHTL